MDKLKDLACERASLCCLIKYGGAAWVDIDGLIDVKDYTYDKNQSVFKILKTIFQRNPEAAVDIPTIISVANELKINDLFDGDKDYLNKLTNFHTELSNVREFAAKIKRLSVARDLFYLADDIKKDISKVTGSESLSEIINLAENKLLNFTNNLSANADNKIQSVSDGLSEWLDNVESNPVETIGLSTGYKIFDRITGGLRRKSITVIAARSGVGKSLFAVNIGLRLAIKHKIPIFLTDTEMDLTLQWSRLLSILSDCGISEIENGTYSYDAEKKRRVRKAEKLLGDISFSYKNVSDMSFEEIMSYVRRWVVQTVGKTKGVTNDCLWIYDYIKLNSAKEISHNIAEHQSLGFQVIAMKALCHKYDIPCLSFGQMNRDGIVRAETDVIAGSDRILFNIDNLFAYQVKTVEEMAETGPTAGNRKLIPLKARQGALLECGNYINYHHKEGTAMIKEGELKSYYISNKGFSIE